MGHGNGGLAALLLAWAGATAAQYVPPIEMGVPAGFEIRRVAPGAGTTLAIDVVNRTASTREVRLQVLGGSAPGWDHYRFSSGDACRVEQPLQQPVSIAVGMLAPGERRQCRFAVQRDAQSTRDLIFRVVPAGSDAPASPAIYIGTVVDRALSLELAQPLRHGDREAIVRMTVRNLDASATAPAHAHGCFGAVPGLSIDGNLPGGCPAPSAGVCAPPAPPMGPEFSVAFDPLAPGSSRSCLMRIRTRDPIAQALPSISASLLDETFSDAFVPFVGVADPDIANNFDTVDLVAEPAGVVPAAVSVPGPSPLILAVLVLLAAYAGRRRASGRSAP